MQRRSVLINPRLRDVRSSNPQLDEQINRIWTENQALLFQSLQEIAKGTLYTADEVGAVLWAQTAAELAASVTPTNYAIPSHEACGYFMPERYGDNTVPGTTEMSTTINTTVLVASAAGGGTVLISGRNRITSPIEMAAKVSLTGAGPQASTIEADGCDGITFDFYTGFGTVIVEKLGIIGAGSTTTHGIRQIGSLDDADELYGVTIRDNHIVNFNVGISFRQARLLYIYGNWIQNVNTGMSFIGKVLRCSVWANEIVRATPVGTGEDAAMYFDLFNFSAGTGLIGPEGWEIFGGNQFFGFDYGVVIEFGRYFNIVGNDFSNGVCCIAFTTVQDGFNIERNFIQTREENAIAIDGAGLASVVDSKINIRANLIQSAPSTSAGTTGIRINGAGNANQNFVTIEDNLLLYFAVNDILLNNAGSCWVIRNRCASSTPTNSIDVPNVVAGTVYIDQNLCAKVINYLSAEAVIGQIVEGHNTINGTTQRAGNPNETAANIADDSAAVNTTGKYAGKLIWDSTNTRQMRASGSAAADPWHVVDGSATVTPS